MQTLSSQLSIISSRDGQFMENQASKVSHFTIRYSALNLMVRSAYSITVIVLGNECSDM